MQTLAERTNILLQQNNMMLSTAESCTGGWIAKVMTDIAGSSASFDRGFVTYSNAAKQDMLGVSREILETHGAVSLAVVEEMAKGALQYSLADISVAISGIAGPRGGSADKPVGTVCFAWAIKNGEINSSMQLFSGDRNAVRKQSAKFALQGVLQLLNPTCKPR